MYYIVLQTVHTHKNLPLKKGFLQRFQPLITTEHLGRPNDIAGSQEPAGLGCPAMTGSEDSMKIPIGAMGMVYLPTWMVDFYGFHVGKYTSPMDGMGFMNPPEHSPPETIWRRLLLHNSHKVTMMIFQWVYSPVIESPLIQTEQRSKLLWHSIE